VVNISRWKKQDIDDTQLCGHVFRTGANDGAGIPVTETKKNLQDIINKVQAAIAGTTGNGRHADTAYMGTRYADDFRVCTTDLAKQNNMALIPSFWKVVARRKINLQTAFTPMPKEQRLLLRMCGWCCRNSCKS
jgi:acyl-CoA thioesterase-1